MKLKWRLLIMLAVLGAVCTWQGFPDWLALKKPAIDITELWYTDLDELKPGTHVCFDVTLVWDQVGSSTEQTKTFGITTSERTTGQYYLLPLCSGEDDGYVYPDPFLLVWCSASYESAMMAQVDKSDEWWQSDGDFDSVPTSTLHFDGILRKIPSNTKKQMVSNLLNSGEAFDDYFVDCLFKPIAVPGAVTAMTIAGLLCLMATLVILFIMIMATRNKTAPVQTNLVQPPVQQQPVQNTFVQQPIQNAFVQQPVQNAFAQPPVQNTFAQQPVMQPPVQNTFVQPPVQPQPVQNAFVQQPIQSAPIQAPPVQNVPPIEDTTAARQSFAGAFAPPPNDTSGNTP